MTGQVLGVAGLAERLRTVAPRAGETRVVAVDGRSGAGKTTLARRLAEQLGATLVQLEDLYDGWDGLEAGIAVAATDVLAPLAAGRAGAYRRYDWHAGRYAEQHPVPAGGTVVLEGVGAAAAAIAPFAAATIWVEAPREVRRQRALGRSEDGDAYVGHWDGWARQERIYLDRDRPDERADLVVDGAVSDVGADRLVVVRAPWSARPAASASASGHGRGSRAPAKIR